MKEPLRLPLADLRWMIGLRRREPPTVPPASSKPGRLEMDGLRLKGRLVDGSEQPGASCLVWHPDLGLGRSPSLPGASGRIVHREPRPPKPTGTEVQRVELAGGGMAVIRVLPGGQRVLEQVAPAKAAGQPQIVQPALPGARPSLHLRSGDTIPCEVTGINEK